MAPNDKLKPLLDNAQYAEQSRKSDTSAIIFSVLITAIVFSALSFFWQKNDSDNNTEIEQLSSQVQTLSDQVAILQLSLTTSQAIEDDQLDVASDIDFKTYTSSAFGYEFDYTKDWLVAISNVDSKNLLLGPNASESGNAVVGISVTPSEDSLEEYLLWMEENTQLSVNRQVNTQVSGIKAIEVFYSSPTGERKMFLLKNGSNIINIHLNSTDDEHLVHFNQIVNSFKLK